VAASLRLTLLEHKARTGRRGDDLVFGRTAGAPFTPTNVRKQAHGAWAAAAVGAFLRGKPLAVELEPIGLHECRHTYVSLMHAAGRSLEEIGDYVGHSSAYMTDHYRHLLEGQRTAAADALDALLAASAAQL
jgi:integrase